VAICQLVRGTRVVTLAFGTERLTLDFKTGRVLHH
jgi:hypothetical protein